GSAAQPAGRAASGRVGGVRNRLFEWAIDSPWRSLPATWVSSADTVVMYSISGLRSDVQSGPRHR
ncbi:hypothetical protein, partial [Acinetobacter baumannii]|uniref:hypothetical protein n=2 Tax=Acinetobacter baumannii TaxID=470 RepID=UPI001486C0F1